ncbi:MAG: ATP-binding protein [Oscillibacter sp.]|nr:ATP-binding protein [Oscillibacter sp.]
MRYQEMLQRMNGMVIFRDLLTDDVVAAFRTMLKKRCKKDAEDFTSACAEFEARLFRHGDDWGAYLHEAVLVSENVCILGIARGAVTEVMETCLDRELELLDQMAEVTLEALLEDFEGGPDFLVGWRAEPRDITADYRERMARVGSKGYGIFARYHMFTVENGQLVPVKHPDPQQLEELPGYEKEREKVIANTKALLSGKPANNVLLYGDAGTGKSSAIKAIANAFAEEGLRLVEVKKNQLYQIPDLMDTLAANPLKFILFLDDLSFTANDANFAALKAILEGSVGGRAHNIAVYATSNRRHLIKETLSDRTGDDIHESDTRQELMSLSARFGLTITFLSPDRDRYLHIVRELARQYGLEADERELSVRSEAFAIRMGGRSARVAKQFIELCKAGVPY